MSVPSLQLIGQACVLCHKAIVLELTAQFCGTCSCPVHTACKLPTPAATDVERCATCGASAAQQGESHQRTHGHMAAIEAVNEARLGSPLIQMLIGLGSSCVGVFLTVAGYRFAAAGGSRFFLVWQGAILAGVTCFAHGFGRWRSSRKSAK